MADKKPKKRKPRRKRKLVEPTQPNEIPYLKYRIEWMDIFPVNEEWLFSKDRYTIKMFASYDIDHDTNEMTFGDRTMIPLACVKKMVKLK